MDDTLVDWRRPFRLLAIGTAVVLVAAAAFLTQVLLASHHRYQAAAADSLGNLTLNLERYLVTRLEAADHVLRTAVAEHRRLGVPAQGHHPGFDAVLADLHRRLPDGPDMRAADRSGLALHGPLVDLAAPFDVSARQFFIEATATGHLVVGLPIMSRVTHRWVLPVARALRDEQGDPAGVVYVMLDMDTIAALFRSQKIGRHGAVTLFNADRQLLVRVPQHPGLQDERPVRLSSRETLAAIEAGRTTAAFTTVSTIDGHERTIMFRKLAAYPAYVLVALSVDEVMMPWRVEVAVAVAFWCLLAAAGAALLVQQARSGRARAAAWTSLQAARRQAEAFSASKSEFLASMSHEIRTPLNAVLGFAQIGHGDPGTGPEARRHFGRILDAGRLLHGLLNDVLDLSRIEAGKLVLHPEPVQLRSALRHAVELVQDRAREKNLDLRFTVDERVPEVAHLDPLRLGQILLNLLSNAVKFTDTGHVALSADVIDHRLMLMVADSGPGLDPAERERLFQPFEQGAPDLARRHGGVGLGLAITKRLVEHMDGQITVSSRPGQGSAFTVWLPLVAVPARADGTPVATATPVPPNHRLDGLRVLVVEDNATNQIVLQGLLELEGAAAEVVPDGASAVARVAAQDGRPYHVALLELALPDIDGCETARRLRAVDPGLPLIGQTGHVRAEDHARCLEAGMADRVTKPINPEDLVRTVLRHARRPGAAPTKDPRPTGDLAAT